MTAAPRMVSGEEAAKVAVEHHSRQPETGLAYCGYCGTSWPCVESRLAYTVQVQAEQIAAVQALHRRGNHDFTVGDCALEECGHEDECPTETKPVCSGCWVQAEEIDEYFCEKRTPEWVMWPCPTVRALGVTS